LPYHKSRQAILLGRDPDDFSAPALAWTEDNRLICEGIMPVTRGKYGSVDRSRDAARNRSQARKAVNAAAQANNYMADAEFTAAMAALPTPEPVNLGPDAVVAGQFGGTLQRKRQAEPKPEAELKVPAEYHRIMDAHLANIAAGRKPKLAKRVVNTLHASRSGPCGSSFDGVLTPQIIKLENPNIDSVTSGFVRTETARDIWRSLDLVRSIDGPAGTMISGAPGIGKTETLLEYAEQQGQEAVPPCAQPMKPDHGLLASAAPAYAYLTKPIDFAGAPPSRGARAVNDTADALCAQLGLPPGSIST